MAMPNISSDDVADALASTQAALALKKESDPVKDGRVKAPRDKDGNITGWIKGMAKCSGCGGNHLNPAGFAI